MNHSTPTASQDPRGNAPPVPMDAPLGGLLHRDPSNAGTEPPAALVQGTAKARIAAARQLSPWAKHAKRGVVPRRFRVPSTDGALLGAFVAALAAPENQGARHDKVRQQLYGCLCEFADPGVPALLVAALARESTAVRAEIYELLSRRTEEICCRALVRGYRDEPGAAREQLGAKLWRNDRALVLLVGEELIPSWNGDRAYAQEIIALLREEHILLPPAWLQGAPADLLQATADLLED